MKKKTKTKKTQNAKSALEHPLSLIAPKNDSKNLIIFFINNIYEDEYMRRGMFKTNLLLEELRFEHFSCYEYLK
jgi:hypothetical protein